MSGVIDSSPSLVVPSGSWSSRYLRELQYVATSSCRLFVQDDGWASKSSNYLIRRRKTSSETPHSSSPRRSGLLLLLPQGSRFPIVSEGEVRALLWAGPSPVALLSAQTLALPQARRFYSCAFSHGHLEPAHLQKSMTSGPVAITLVRSAPNLACFLLLTMEQGSSSG